MLEPVTCGWQGTDYGGTDYTNDIGSFVGQPPLVAIHGTMDIVNPYYNGQRLVDRAQSAGLSAEMITLEGLGQGNLHVPWTAINTEYFEDLATSLYQNITKGAQIPEGCHEL